MIGYRLPCSFPSFQWLRVMACKRTMGVFPVGRELTEVTRAYVKRHVSGFRDRAKPKAIIYSTASSHFELSVEPSSQDWGLEIKWERKFRWRGKGALKMPFEIYYTFYASSLKFCSILSISSWDIQFYLIWIRN